MLPPLYPIIDLDCFAEPKEAERTTCILAYAQELASAGVTLMQYRAKNASSREMLSQARELRRIVGPNVKLIMNDRADLCIAAGFDGVHVGQDDLAPEDVRAIIGPNRILGVSTHNPEQLRKAATTSADYVAIGPIFQTASKQNPDPVVGLDGLRAARELTSKPLVAIGGITRANCREVIAAGADSVAVIGDLLSAPAASAEEFDSVLRSPFSVNNNQ